MIARIATSLLVLVAGVTAQVTIEDVPGQADYKLKSGKVSDLSGLTWIRGQDFYTVSNQAQSLLPLKIEIQPNGKIASAKLGQNIAVKSALDDFEGIAYWPERDRLYVSTERPPGIVGFDRQGDATFKITVPQIFAKARRNKGLESLAYGAGAFWTANEDALDGDGDQSSPTRGAMVRLQKFDDRFRPTAQFAYQTGPSLLRASGSGTGVTDLAVLPDGTLLCLERAVGLGLFAKIYSIDFQGATDTTAIRKLSDAEIQPVKKRLRFERATGARNFEGIALGPELEDGWRSLILVEDSGGSSEHALMPLRIKVTPRVSE